MAVLTEKEKLQREIAKLSAKINRASSTATTSSYPLNRPSRHASSSSSWSAHVPNVRHNPTKPFGNKNRSLVLDNRKTTSSTPPVASGSIPPPKQSIARPGEASTTPSASATTTPITTPITTPVLASAVPTRTISPEPAVKPNYVHHTTKKGNMSLVKPEIYGKFEKARLTRTAKSTATASGKSSGKPAYNMKRSYGANANGGANLVFAGKHGHSGKRTFASQLSSANGGTSVAKRVVIDGVTYEFAEDGNLKRVDDALPTKQKKRKLDNREGSQGKKKAKRSIETHCRFFTKTGTCLRADRCPYIHDPHRIAICSRLLRNKCPLTAETCPVSHKPSAHNTPSCAHFQRNGFCRDDDACLYPHVKVADDAPVCVAFSTEGWCDKGANCQERHAWECREYSEKGVCSRGAKCGLAHILKAKAVQPNSEGSPLEDSAQKGVASQLQPDDVEPVLPGIPPMPEKTIEAEQGLAQDQLLQEPLNGTLTGNDFERQEDFIQFANLEDLDPNGSGDDDMEEGVSDSAEGDDTGKSDEGEGSDEKIKYSFDERSDEASGDEDDEAEELMIID